MTKTSSSRALKAPAAARALPKLADRAREEQWGYERFLEAVLSTEVASRHSHGGENRIKAARFPQRKTLEEFDFTFQRSVKRQVVEHLGRLDFLHAKRTSSCSGRRGPARRTADRSPSRTRARKSDFLSGLRDANPRAGSLDLAAGLLEWAYSGSGEAGRRPSGSSRCSER